VGKVPRGLRDVLHECNLLVQSGGVGREAELLREDDVPTYQRGRLEVSSAPGWLPVGAKAASRGDGIAVGMNADVQALVDLLAYSNGPPSRNGQSTRVAFDLRSGAAERPALNLDLDLRGEALAITHDPIHVILDADVLLAVVRPTELVAQVVAASCAEDPATCLNALRTHGVECHRMMSGSGLTKYSLHLSASRRIRSWYEVGRAYWRLSLESHWIRTVDALAGLKNLFLRPTREEVDEGRLIFDRLVNASDNAIAYLMQFRMVLTGTRTSIFTVDSLQGPTLVVAPLSIAPEVLYSNTHHPRWPGSLVAERGGAGPQGQRLRVVGLAYAQPSLRIPGPNRATVSSGHSAS
jgi:hypothetical protein